MNTSNSAYTRSIVKMTLALTFVVSGGAALANQSRTVYVGPPNGVDDTAELQASLNQCIDAEDDCIVQLGRGTYRTSQLVTYGFRGTFRGKGRRHTKIEALPALPVTSTPVQQPNTTDHTWPSLILFVDGRINVSDMSIEVPSVPATQPYELFGLEFTDLVDVLRVMGKRRTKASFERVNITGRVVEGSFWGYNLVNGLTIGGELPRETITGNFRDDFYPLSGNFRIVDCRIQDAAGSHFFPHHIGSRIKISRNRYVNVGFGVELGNVEHSTVEVSWNTGTLTQVATLLYNPFFPPDRRSWFDIHHNSFKVAGPGIFGGLLALDNEGGPSVQNLTVWRNRIDAAGVPAVLSIGNKNPRFAANRLRGSGDAAIQMIDATGCRLVRNDVSGYDTAGAPKIVLDESTSKCLVLGPYGPGEVLDLGTDNKVVTPPSP